eukprot:COSAG04_NODE_29904_length_266_cov_0.592814_1_plen_22_part_10
MFQHVSAMIDDVWSDTPKHQRP